MALTKRVRYEVLRRDAHTCRYCGGTAPDVVLTVDHVVPVALGGADGPENLVTACKDCNAGKSSTSPDAPLVADVSEQAAVYAEAMKAVIAGVASDAKARDAYRRKFLKAWEAYDRERFLLETDWAGTLKRWFEAQMPITVIVEAVDIAFGARKVYDRHRYRYMAGIVWSRLTEMQEAAAATMQRRAASSSSDTNKICLCCGWPRDEAWDVLLVDGACRFCGHPTDDGKHSGCHSYWRGWHKGVHWQKTGSGPDLSVARAKGA